jgi:hypothetical protein
MARKHALIVAVVLGLAAAVGAVAAIKTAGLGQAQANASSTPSQSAQLLRRTRLLDRQEAALRRAVVRRPPKLPRVPRFAPVAAPTPAPASPVAAAPPAAPRVQYVRPAPVIVVKHRSHGEDGVGHEAEGSDD